MKSHITAFSIMLLTATTLIPLNSCKSHKSEVAESNPGTTQPRPVTMEQNRNNRTGRTLIVMYSAETGIAPLLEAAEKYGAEIIYRYENFNGVALVIPEGKDVTEAIRYFKAIEGVISVNRDSIVRPL